MHSVIIIPKDASFVGSQDSFDDQYNQAGKNIAVIKLRMSKYIVDIYIFSLTWLTPVVVSFSLTTNI